MANPEHLKILEKGVDVWNEWRENDGVGIIPDLNGADLYKAGFSKAKLNGADLGSVGLSQSDLNRTNLSQTNLKGADLREADLINVNLNQAVLKDADLAWADLSGANLEDVDLFMANFSDANLNAQVSSFLGEIMQFAVELEMGADSRLVVFQIFSYLISMPIGD